METVVILLQKTITGNVRLTEFYNGDTDERALSKLPGIKARRLRLRDVYLHIWYTSDMSDEEIRQTINDWLFQQISDEASVL